MLLFRKNGMQFVVRGTFKEEKEFYNAEYVSEFFLIVSGVKKLMSKEYGTKEYATAQFRSNTKILTEPLPF